MIFFNTGDKVIFVEPYDPGFAPDDPFFIEPVPKDSKGTIIDIADNHVRVKMDDAETWPKPIIIWKDGAFSDGLKGGMSCLRKCY